MKLTFFCRAYVSAPLCEKQYERRAMKEFLGLFSLMPRSLPASLPAWPAILDACSGEKERRCDRAKSLRRLRPE
jgi:hypothetical protein